MRPVEEALVGIRATPSDQLVRRIAAVPRRARRRLLLRSSLVVFALIGGCAAVPATRQAVFRFLEVPNTVVFMAPDGQAVGTTSISQSAIITNLPVPSVLPGGYEILVNSERPIDLDAVAKADATLQWIRRSDNARIIVMTLANPGEVRFARKDIADATPEGDLLRVRLSRGREAVAGSFPIESGDLSVEYVKWVEVDTVVWVMGTHESREMIVEIADSM